MGGRQAIALLAGIGLAACATPVSTETVTLSSDAFAAGGAMPHEYTCDGANLSPPLSWTATPDEVGAYALWCATRMPAASSTGC